MNTKFQIRIDYAVNGYIVSSRRSNTASWSSPTLYVDTPLVADVMTAELRSHGVEVVTEGIITFDLQVVPLKSQQIDSSKE